ncbi:hypothetical protein LRAMOSA03991 [Lichtheimia ramosa]|uniref:Xaa-Pro dipeptidyl-peptidase-like domain-containing protein n=1 Tax=Lichtheimia ramosa TaxID=688394 RepID=A0A077WXH0_9FUNG|nr:hypothetical protein LRAMOSA03991 [Lichtheimia ramosa]
MTSDTVLLESCHDKTLVEARITYNSHDNSTIVPAIVLAHPYGPLGGNNRNNVIMALHGYFASKGFITASINFRGCGRSKGRTSWTGMPERGDYQAVIDHLLKADKYPKPSHLIISGYSFGSMVAASMAPPEDVHCSYLLISYPLNVQWALATIKSSFFTSKVDELLASQQVHVIYGGHDQFTGLGSYQAWISKKRQNNKQLEATLVPEADHFWFGMEDTLVEKINDWISKILS